MRRALLLLALGALLAGCGGGSDRVAVVADEPIAAEQLDRELEAAEERYARDGRTFPEEGTASWVDLRRELLLELVFREQLEQKAEQLGIRVSEDDVQRRLDESDGGDADAARAAIVFEELTNWVSENRVRVTDAEIREHYEANRERYAPRTLRQSRRVIQVQLEARERDAAMRRFLDEVREEFEPVTSIELE